MSLVILVFNMSIIILLMVSMYIFNAVLYGDSDYLYRVVQNAIPKSFIGRENYSYLICLHLFITCCIGGITYVSAAMLIIAYNKHVCGMFSIAR